MRKGRQATWCDDDYVPFVKDETRSFYETAVRNAVRGVVARLDEALDLTALARGAALSPFHFHRVFRGMVGETPLELQRRLRMERAALRLLSGEGSVTEIAFSSGYDTHESFTRAFRVSYGTSPSEFRRVGAAGEEGAGCVRPPQFELPARCGLHFRVDENANGPDDVSTFTGGLNMNSNTSTDTNTNINANSNLNVEIKQMPELRLATVPHQGPYQRMSEAFARLGELAGRAGLFRHPGVQMIGVYHDDPETTPPEQLRADAGVSVPEEAEIPEGLRELRLPAGRYATTTHVGPYTELGDAWARLMGGWLPASGNRVGAGLSYEIYRNTPADVPANALQTELYLPLA